MENEQNYIKQSIISGLIGAAVFPFLYECYANVMRGFAVALALFGCVLMGFVLAKNSLSKALCGLTFFTLLSVGLGLFLQIIVHRHIVDFLESRSKYFYLSYRDISIYIIKIFTCYISGYIVCIARCGGRAAVRKMRSNSQDTKSFIDNAFGEDDE